MLIDTHSHVNFNAFAKDSREVVERTLKQNIWLINVGSQLTTSQRAVKIASEYPKGVYAAVGLHPIHLNEIFVDEVEIPFNTKTEEFNRQNYEELLKNEKTVAVGETGLDYYHAPEGKEFKEVVKKQREAFVDQIKLAVSYAKPVIIHCRGSKINANDAYEDILEIIKKFPKLKGVVHCFGSSWEIAEKFLNLGFLISFTGIITFKNAESLRQVVKKVPLEKLMAETDAPYLTPEPHRGERNEPAFVKHIAEKIADIKGISFEEVAEVTTMNAKKLFGI